MRNDTKKMRFNTEKGRFTNMKFCPDETTSSLSLIECVFKTSNSTPIVKSTKSAMTAKVDVFATI